MNCMKRKESYLKSYDQRIGQGVENSKPSPKFAPFIVNHRNSLSPSMCERALGLQSYHRCLPSMY